MPVSSNQIAGLINQQNQAFASNAGFSNQMMGMGGTFQPQTPFGGGGGANPLHTMGGQLGNSMAGGLVGAANFGITATSLQAAFGVGMFAPKMMRPLAALADPFTGIMQAGSAGGRWGWGGRIAMGGAALGGFMAVGGAINMASDQIIQGAREQMYINTMMSMNATHSTMPGLVGGMGAGGFNKFSMQTGGMIRGMASGDLNTSVGELTGLMGTGLQSGAFRGVISMSQFQSKFKDMVKQVKQVAQTMQSSLQEAYGAMQSFQGMGHYGMSGSAGAVKSAFNMDAGLGMPPGTMMQAGFMGSGISRRFGVHGRIGSNTAMNMAGMLGGANMAGHISTEALREAAGGAQLPQAIAQAAGVFTSAAHNFSRSKHGQRVIMALMDSSSGQIDSAKAAAWQMGMITKKQMDRMYHSNRSKRRVRQSLKANIGSLSGSLIEQLGAEDVLTGYADSAMSSRGLKDGEDADDVMDLMLQRYGGLGEQHADMLQQLSNQTPALKAQIKQRMARELERVSSAKSFQNKYSLEGMKRRLVDKYFGGVSQWLRNAGASISNFGNEVMQDTMGFLLGDEATGQAYADPSTPSAYSNRSMNAYMAGTAGYGGFIQNASSVGGGGMYEYNTEPQLGGFLGAMAGNGGTARRTMGLAAASAAGGGLGILGGGILIDWNAASGIGHGGLRGLGGRMMSSGAPAAWARATAAGSEAAAAAGGMGGRAMAHASGMARGAFGFAYRAALGGAVAGTGLLMQGLSKLSPIGWAVTAGDYTLNTKVNEVMADMGMDIDTSISASDAKFLIRSRKRGLLSHRALRKGASEHVGGLRGLVTEDSLTSMGDALNFMESGEHMLDARVAGGEVYALVKARADAETYLRNAATRADLNPNTVMRDLHAARGGLVSARARSMHGFGGDGGQTLLRKTLRGAGMGTSTQAMVAVDELLMGGSVFGSDVNRLSGMFKMGATTAEQRNLRSQKLYMKAIGNENPSMSSKYVGKEWTWTGREMMYELQTGYDALSAAEQGGFEHVKEMLTSETGGPHLDKFMGALAASRAADAAGASAAAASEPAAVALAQAAQAHHLDIFKQLTGELEVDFSEASIAALNEATPTMAGMGGYGKSAKFGGMAQLVHRMATNPEARKAVAAMAASISAPKDAKLRRESITNLKQGLGTRLVKMQRMGAYAGTEIGYVTAERILKSQQGIYDSTLGLYKGSGNRDKLIEQRQGAVQQLIKAIGGLDAGGQAAAMDLVDPELQGYAVAGLRAAQSVKHFRKRRPHSGLSAVFQAAGLGGIKEDIFEDGLDRHELTLLTNQAKFRLGPDAKINEDEFRSHLRGLAGAKDKDAFGEEAAALMAQVTAAREQAGATQTAAGGKGKGDSLDKFATKMETMLGKLDGLIKRIEN